MVYLLHFNQNYCHARHYIGYVDGDTESLEERMRRHRSGDGANLIKVITEAGIGFELVRTWPEGDRNFERRLKRQKKSNRLCPICKGGGNYA
jgi:predicted GIY-YIG superfamily endonuclease